MLRKLKPKSNLYNKILRKMQYKINRKEYRLLYNVKTYT